MRSILHSLSGTNETESLNTETVGAIGMESSGVVDSQRLDDAAVISTGENISCLSCLEEFSPENLYRCGTCMDPQDSDQQNNLCESCILWHLRRNHEINDYRGYRPAVCDVHERICILFCNECEIVFCQNCFVQHSGHKFQSLIQKSVEIRKSIFDYLTKIELLSKPMKHLESVSVDSFAQVADLNLSLGEDSVTQTLEEIYQKVIQSYKPLWKQIAAANHQVILSESSIEDRASTSVLDELHPSENSNDEESPRFEAVQSFRERIKIVVDTFDGKMNELKMMLQLSDGNCISSFTQAEVKLQAHVKKFDDELSLHSCLEWKIGLENFLRNSLTVALKSKQARRVKITRLEKIVPFKEWTIRSEQTNVDWDQVISPDSSINAVDSPKDFSYLSPIFDSTYEPGNCSFKVLKKFKGKGVSATIIECFCVSIPDVKGILKSNDVIAFLTESKIEFFCLLSHRHLGQREMHPSSIPISFIKLADDSFVLDLFSPDCKILSLGVKRTPIVCKTKPTFIERSSLLIFVVDLISNIIVYDKTTDLELHIDHMNHGLSSVDNIYFHSGNKLILIDYRMKLKATCCVITSSVDEMDFEVQKVEQMELPVSEIYRCGFNIPTNSLFAYSSTCAWELKSVSWTG